MNWRFFGSAFASRSSLTGLLILSAVILGMFTEVRGQSTSLTAIRRAFNNGQFEEVVRIAPDAVLRGRKTGMRAAVSEIGVIQAHALMRLERYDDAAVILDEALIDANRSKQPRIIANVYLAKATLSRFHRDFPSAIQFARSALTSAPEDSQIKLEYHLAIGRIMYSSGFDVAAIIWLERAEALSAKLPMSSAHLDVLGHLGFAWAAKFNYAKALEYGEKLVRVSEKTEFKYRHRLALYELAGHLSAAGQERRSNQMRETGLRLSLTEKDDYQSCLFLFPMILTSLYKGDIGTAEKHLSTLERVDRNGRFQFEAVLGKAVITGFRGQKEVSDSHFKELTSLKAHSDYLVPHWKAILAERRKDWPSLIGQMEILRKISEERNFREDLPAVYFGLAKGHWGLGKQDMALEYAKRSAAIVEGDRSSGDTPLSLSMLEMYHAVYRLLTEIEESKGDAFATLERADYSKARVLRDRIENSALRRKGDLDSEIRKRVEDLSTLLIEGEDVRQELAGLEKTVTLSLPQSESERNGDLKTLSDSTVLKDTSVVSYFFTLSGELRAFVIEGSNPVRVIKLSISESEVDVLTESIRTKIRDRVFFKNDGKDIYDKLLAPLSIDGADHIVIVPDKSLWKIPFHALSPDGESYLIEKRTVSYSPSVSILLNELKQSVPIRKTIQVFANDSFEDRYLAYVNREAAKVGRLFGARPMIGATRDQLLRSGTKSDILHFSMHAEADPEDPLDSFLAFKALGRDSGRITVQDLLSIRLKKQNLAFLASCDTNNVLNGEGLISIAWALLGSGSSSVISAQWEADDRSAEIFTEEFYKHYRKGTSTAKALQSAAVRMIYDKSSGSHEPYFWASFSLLGDYR